MKRSEIVLALSSPLFVAALSLRNGMTDSEIHDCAARSLGVSIDPDEADEDGEILAQRPRASDTHFAIAPAGLVIDQAQDGQAQDDQARDDQAQGDQAQDGQAQGDQAQDGQAQDGQAQG